MKITASRADDIRRAREEYDAETARLKEKSTAQENAWRAETYRLKAEMEKKVADIIGPTSLNLSIKADPWGYFGAKSWTIAVNANEGGNFKDNIALVWNWEAKLDNEGNVVKDSGSWSGLKATTIEQLNNLEESVRIMKILNNIDWKVVLNSPMANYDDYMDPELSKSISDRNTARPKFEDELLNAALEDLIGTNVAIQLGSDSYYRGKVGMLITKMSDKFVTGYIFPWSYIDQPNVDVEYLKSHMGDERRASKEKIVIYQGEPVTQYVRE